MNKEELFVEFFSTKDIIEDFFTKPLKRKQFKKKCGTEVVVYIGIKEVMGPRGVSFAI